MWSKGSRATAHCGPLIFLVSETPKTDTNTDTDIVTDADTDIDTGTNAVDIGIDTDTATELLDPITDTATLCRHSFNLRPLYRSENDIKKYAVYQFRQLLSKKQNTTLSKINIDGKLHLHL